MSPAGFAAMLVLAGCSASPSATPRPTSTPTASPTATATPLPVVDIGCNPSANDACVGPLTAGTHNSALLEPQITFTVPAGWANHADSDGEYVLLPPGSHPGPLEGAARDWIAIEANVTLMLEGCPPPGTDVFDATKTAADIATWMAGRAHLVTTQPQQVSLGGLDGMTIDVRLANDAPIECFDVPAVMLVHGLPPSDGYDQAIGADIAMRFYFFDRGENVVMIEIDDVSGGDRLDTFTRVVNTVRFSG